MGAQAPNWFKILKFYLPTEDEGIMLRKETGLDNTLKKEIIRKEEDIKEIIVNNLKPYNHTFFVSIVKKENEEDKGKFIGEIILENDMNDVRNIFINYWVKRAYRNEGYSTSATKLICNIFKNAYDSKISEVESIKAFVTSNNYSIKVLEKNNFKEVADPLTPYGRAYILDLKQPYQIDKEK
ncbi:MAG: GNAT family N-acetyltransferase [Candidatus Micrarchaeia archaeon]